MRAPSRDDEGEEGDPPFFDLPRGSPVTTSNMVRRAVEGVWPARLLADRAHARQMGDACGDGDQLRRVLSNEGAGTVVTLDRGLARLVAPDERGLVMLVG